jgi:CRISPR/Cas system CSM-associated protein Csm5 (group 7 of RAMP superfamily)
MEQIPQHENLEKAKDGIKRRLGDWNRQNLYKLREHLGGMAGFYQKTFNEAFTEMQERTLAGTPEGRLRGNTGVSNDPHVTTMADIDRLPWVVDHDNVDLGMNAGDVLTVQDLEDIVKEILKA